jgi:uncharacterized protein YjbI with pentapeptide repeats
VLVFGAIFLLLPGWIIPASEFQRPHVEASSRIQRQNELRGTAIQAFAGLVLLFGALYTARSYKLSKDGQFNDRLRWAVDQVHTGGVAAIGGIVGLERLASDSERDRRNIIELMATYVRMQSPLPPAAVPLTGAGPVLDSAVQTALATIARGYVGVADLRVLDLSSSFLRGADLRNAVLPAVYMRGSDLATARLAEMSADLADLYGANLTSVDATKIRLRGADLRGATLTNAIMSDADLRDARLRAAHLSRVALIGAQLARCDLSDTKGDELLLHQADLEGAQLRRADWPKAFVVGAVLRGANLTEARLVDASMQHVDLRDADLRRANLEGADLRGADLRGADCRGAVFTRADLRNAVYTEADIREAELQDARRDSADLLRSGMHTPQAGDVLSSVLRDAVGRNPPGWVQRGVGLPRSNPNEPYIVTMRRWLRARRRS